MSTARHVALGAVAGAVGTAAMDTLLYARYRRAGGKEDGLRWEFAEGVTTWDEASAPGTLARKVARLVTRTDPPGSWARPATNVMHWATGVGWGAQYAVLASRASRHRRLAALALGPVAWLAGYVVLPLAGVYEPIWKYDAGTLAKDLSAHVVFGVTTSAALAALDREVR